MTEMTTRRASELERGSALYHSIIDTAPHREGVDDTVRTLARALQRLDAGHRRIRREFAGSLGLSASEFNAFMLISQTVGLTPKQLAIDLGLTNSAVTSMIDRLEAAGLITRKPNPEDRRSLYLDVSIEGAAAVEWVASDYLDTVARLIASSEQLGDPEFADQVAHMANIILTSTPTERNA